jgi:hypothetical protein
MSVNVGCGCVLKDTLNIVLCDCLVLSGSEPIERLVVYSSIVD